jgi:tetratricopeptide (TPR) repeat protein
MRRHNCLLLIMLTGWLALGPLALATAPSIQQALNLYQQKRYGEAARAFQSVEAQTSLTAAQRVNMLYYRADALYRSGQPRKAATVYQQVVKMAPGSQAGQYARVALQRMEKLGQPTTPEVAQAKPATKSVAKQAEKKPVNKASSQIAAKSAPSYSKPLAPKPAEKQLAQAATKPTVKPADAKADPPKAMVATQDKSAAKPVSSNAQKTLVKAKQPTTLPDKPNKKIDESKTAEKPWKKADPKTVKTVVADEKKKSFHSPKKPGH